MTMEGEPMANDAGTGGQGVAMHTAGPWAIRTYARSDVVNIRSLDDTPVAQVAWMPETGMEVTLANARLITRAPEMLRVLQLLIDGNTDIDSIYEDAREVVLKATSACLVA